jgi:signal transduction histidine kinase
MNGCIKLLPFYIRFGLFSIIWSVILFSKENQTDVFLLLFCALSLSIYFLIPIVKWNYFFIITLSSTSFLYGFLFEEKLILPFLLLVLLYIFESAFYIKPDFYRIEIVFFVLILLICSMLIFDMTFLGMTLSYLLWFLIALILTYLNTHYFKTLNQAKMYEEILGEYRKVKRQSMLNETAVRMEERARIAREMHDSVGHKLTALSMQIEMLLMKEENDLLRLMKDTVNESLEETRKAVRAFTMDDIEGLSTVIHLIRKLESESPLRIHLTTKQGALSLPLSNKCSITLYRAIQESLTNAMKYGTSREVYVTLGVSPIGQLSFEIRNKFDPNKPFHEGFGLKGMRQRVEELGGRLHIYQLDDQFVTEGILPIEEGEG